jgi:hypothetical protein
MAMLQYMQASEICFAFTQVLGNGHHQQQQESQHRSWLLAASGVHFSRRAGVVQQNSKYVKIDLHPGVLAPLHKAHHLQPCTCTVSCRVMCW